MKWYLAVPLILVELVCLAIVQVTVYDAALDHGLATVALGVFGVTCYIQGRTRRP